MTTKNIDQIIKPGTPHFVGDGFRVHSFINNGTRFNMKEMDPFIMFDYNSTFHFPPTSIPKGVGVHPHKGFETVTIAYKGRVEHGDSSGGGGVIGEGDVQWMTAGAGVLHKEFHETEWSKKGGDFQMVQLWINLPKAFKQTPAKYQSIQNENIEKFLLPDGKGFVEVIAGSYQGVMGQATTFSPINMYNLKGEKGAKATFEFPAHYTTMVLVLEGSIQVNGNEIVPTDHLAYFAKNGESFTVDILNQAVVLVLAGEPLKEPIAHYGPFVMNTQAELVDAFEEFQSGKFGVLH
jgi:hypothetical protein